MRPNFQRDQQPRHALLHGARTVRRQRQATAANEVSDLYAVGVTLYYLLTRKYPYGEIEPFQNPRFGDPMPPTRYRPDIPEWLEAVLLKAVAREPATALRDRRGIPPRAGTRRPAPACGWHARTPLMQRDPLLGLKLLAAASLVLNLLLLSCCWHAD